jgi:transcriptional regulator with GAF, ATPase, and Fis domain
MFDLPVAGQRLPFAFMPPYLNTLNFSQQDLESRVGWRLTRDAIPVEVRVQRESGPKSTIQEARESAEREHILRALDESNWNVSGAARALGMERTNLHKRIRALGLTRGK